MTVIQFTPPTVQTPFAVQITLDGQLYNMSVGWNLFGQRYFFNLTDLAGNLIVSLPVVGPQNLLAGYFDVSTMVWSDQTQTFTINP